MRQVCLPVRVCVCACVYMHGYACAFFVMVDEGEGKKEIFRISSSYKRISISFNLTRFAVLSHHA